MTITDTFTCPSKYWVALSSNSRVIVDFSYFEVRKSQSGHIVILSMSNFDFFFQYACLQKTTTNIQCSTCQNWWDAKVTSYHMGWADKCQMKFTFNIKNLWKEKQLSFWCKNVDLFLLQHQISQMVTTLCQSWLCSNGSTVHSTGS